MAEIKFVRTFPFFYIFYSKKFCVPNHFPITKTMQKFTLVIILVAINQAQGTPMYGNAIVKAATSLADAAKATIETTSPAKKTNLV